MWIKTVRGWKSLVPKTKVFIDTIKEAGVLARKQGFPSETCPHPKGTQEASRWLTGWCDQDFRHAKGLA